MIFHADGCTGKRTALYGLSFPDPCFAILQFKKHILDYRHRPCRLVATYWLAHLQAKEDPSSNFEEKHSLYQRGPSKPRNQGKVDPPRPPCVPAQGHGEAAIQDRRPLDVVFPAGLAITSPAGNSCKRSRQLVGIVGEGNHTPNLDSFYLFLALWLSNVVCLHALGSWIRA